MKPDAWNEKLRNFRCQKALLTSPSSRHALWQWMAPVTKRKLKQRAEITGSTKTRFVFKKELNVRTERVSDFSDSDSSSKMQV